MFLASWQVMAAVFVIEEMVVYFSDDDLQNWCEVSVFGTTPEVELISTDIMEYRDKRERILKQQEENFGKAIEVIK